MKDVSIQVLLNYWTAGVVLAYGIAWLRARNRYVYVYEPARWWIVFSYTGSGLMFAWLVGAWIGFSL